MFNLTVILIEGINMVSIVISIVPNTCLTNMIITWPLAYHHQHQHQVSKRQISLQRFAVEPDNITVNIGESVVLPCKISNKAGIVQCK